MSVKKVWFNDENVYVLRPDQKKDEKLVPAIYRLEASETLGLYLKRLEDNFSFPYKIYGLEEALINRIMKSFRTAKGNLGVLLNGLKGTGKTVTSKIICNKINLPVIIIGNNYGSGTANFINEIQQDITILIDEYEKVYDQEKDNGTLLTVMDGVLSNGFKKLFILTTNHLYVNENLLSRPSRIRYIKEFKDLPIKTINEIIDDKLEYPEFRDALVNYISTLRHITVDIVKSVIEEVNIHQESPENFKGVFNVSVRNSKYNVFEVVDEKEILIAQHTDISCHDFTDEDHIAVGSWFNVGGSRYGKFVRALSEDRAVFEVEVVDEDLSVKANQIIEAALMSDEEEFNPLVVGKQVKTLMKDSEKKQLQQVKRKEMRVIQVRYSYGRHYSYNTAGAMGYGDIY
jgi:hypothetical protein